jgi:exodeoxyribonuclease V alpha subunit
VAEALAAVETETGRALSPSQRAAAETVLAAKVAVVRLAARPVGAASSTRASARRRIRSRASRVLVLPTPLHRLLEVDPAHGGFLRDAGNPLDCDLLVVDEASMRGEQHPGLGPAQDPQQGVEGAGLADAGAAGDDRDLGSG